MGKEGQDISHYQKINWSKMKTDFIIAKCTESTAFVDQTFATNKAECRKRGIPFGGYHFARGGDAVKEATFFLKNYGEIQDGDILALDWEIKHPNPQGWCLDWLKKVEELTGVKPLIYLNSSTAKSWNWDLVIENGNKLWIANYGINDGTRHPNPSTGKWKEFYIHQYTSKGKVNGIVGNVDLDYMPETTQTKMIYPLTNWTTARRGYTFGQKTWYNTRHIGLDVIVPKGTSVYAWRDIEITFAQYGYQGGYQCWVKDKGKLVRLLHLQKLPLKGKFKQGQAIAYTGNTGAFTTGAHVHIDCSRNGKLELYNFSNFIDPEIYFRYED
jgi:GH25 family lysozyme M1 (1,4-beta-N-acetylmuramidase)